MTRSRMMLTVGLVGLHAVGLALAWLSMRDLHDSAGMLFYCGTGFLAMTLLRPAATSGITSRDIAYVAGLFVSGILLLALLGAPLVDSIRLSGGSLAHGAVMAAIYQGVRFWFPTPPAAADADWLERWRTHWVPRRASDLAGLLVGSLVAGLIIVDWGGTWSARSDVSAATAMWLWLVTAVLTAWSVATIGLSMQRPTPETFRPREFVTFVILGAATIGLIWFALGADAVAYNWTLLLPSVLAGFMLTPWATAAHCLVLSGTAVALSNSEFAARPGSSIVANDLALGGLIATCTGTAILLSLIQQEHRRLETALTAESQSAIDQSEMLRVVLSSMSDGVVVADHAGRADFHNEAAGRMLRLDGRVFDARYWPEHIQVLSEAGEVVTASGTDDHLAAARAAGETSLRLRVNGEDPSQTRVVGVEYVGIQIGGRERYVVLMRDLTEQLDREAAMSSFAAVAAHDLKAPLTAVAGWIGMAYDELPAGHPIAPTLRGVVRDSDALRESIDRLLQPPA